MTTILTDKRFAHIGRRSEHTPDDGMMLRRRLIRSDEAWPGRSRSTGPWAWRRPPITSWRPASGPIARSATNDCRRRSAACQGQLRVLRLAAGLQTTGCVRGEQGRSLHGRAADRRARDPESQAPRQAVAYDQAPTPTPTRAAALISSSGTSPSQAPNRLWVGPLFFAFVLGVFSPQRRRSAPPG
jgi:hypothetical protein